MAELDEFSKTWVYMFCYLLSITDPDITITVIGHSLVEHCDTQGRKIHLENGPGALDQLYLSSGQVFGQLVVALPSTARAPRGGEHGPHG